MISVQNVSKSFGSIHAVKEVSFEIKSGEVVGFLGPNGAGKTTMMRLITGIFPPSEGKILINGKNLFKSKPAVRAQIGYLAEHNPLYRDMTAKEFLFYVAALKGVIFWAKKREVEGVMDQCDLGAARNRLIGKLSKGYQQRVGLAQALIGSPDFLVLDEPTNGLDPKQISDMRNLIRTFARNRTILLSTHILPEVQATCQRVLILNQGRLVASGTPEGLEGDLRQSEDFIVVLRGAWGEGDQFLKHPDVLEIKLEQDSNGIRSYRIRLKRESPIRTQMARFITEAGFELLELKKSEWSLEDIFLKIVTREEAYV